MRKPSPDRTTLLSPFDSLIINRTRTELLFGMRYRMEIYVPKKLRVRGFWAMPILHGNRLIGTVDPKVDRVVEFVGSGTFDTAGPAETYPDGLDVEAVGF